MFSQQASSQSETGYIGISSRFDVVTSGQYRMPFVRMLGDPSKTRVVIDFSNVTYIDSSGIGTLIAWYKTSKERGKELVIQNCGEGVMEILRTLAVDRMIPIS